MVVLQTIKGATRGVAPFTLIPHQDNDRPLRRGRQRGGGEAARHRDDGLTRKVDRLPPILSIVRMGTDRGWFSTVDHKEIGRRYLVTAFEEEIGAASSENGLFIAVMEFSVLTRADSRLPPNEKSGPGFFRPHSFFATEPSKIYIIIDYLI